MEAKRTIDGPGSGGCSACEAGGGACVLGWAVWVEVEAAAGAAGCVEGPATAFRCLFRGAAYRRLLGQDVSSALCG